MSYKNIFREVPDVVHFAVVDALKKLDDNANLESENIRSDIRLMKQKKPIITSLKMNKAAVIILSVLIASSITITASAAIKKYKLRFADEMDENKVEEIYALANLTETLITSREFSEEELKNLERLWEAYKNDERIPEKEIDFISDSKEYSGEGVVFCTADGIVYIPNESLSEEEMLEIIDMEERIDYSIDIVNSYGYGTDYRERFDKMTDDEMDSLFRLINKCHEDTSGGFSRELSVDEEKRYHEMKHEFEENGAYVEENIAVVDTAEDYNGENVAYAAVDGKYMLPDREVTDAEFLQIIDMQYRVYYMFDRINWEVYTGYRESFPSINYTNERN